MNPGAIAVTVVIIFAAFILFIRIYAKQQIKIKMLEESKKNDAAEIARLKKLIIQFQEVDSEANSNSSDLDSDPDSELEFMQNRSRDTK